MNKKRERKGSKEDQKPVKGSFLDIMKAAAKNANTKSDNKSRKKVGK